MTLSDYFRLADIAEGGRIVIVKDGLVVLLPVKK